MRYTIYEKRGDEMYQQYKEGWLEVISGCMFAGKTEELIRRIKVLLYAHKKVAVFKPKLDDRFDATAIVSHNGSSIDSFVIEKAKEVYAYNVEDYDVIAIDEVQFFDEGIVDVCNQLANKGKRVMVAGLDMDFRGEPFSVMPKLLCYAEFVTKLTAVCVCCGAPATRSQRLVNGKSASYDGDIIQVGADEQYEARCRHCHDVKKH